MRYPGFFLFLALLTFTLVSTRGQAREPTEIVLETPGPTGPLKGRLVRPDRPDAPVIVIIPGSGPTDQDGNNRFGIKAAPYRLLADGLAQRGIATLRIDKRGMFSSRAAVPDANAVTITDYTHDLQGWAATLRHETGVACVWALGHSEGALVALATAAAPDLCGLILVAGAGRPIGTVLREQLRANPANAPVLDQALSAIESLEAGRHVDTTAMAPVLLPLFKPAVQDFLIDAFRYDPATLIASTQKPILILQGDHDLQTNPTDAERLKAANPAARLVILADTNHVLKTVAAHDRAANLATYADPDRPLAPGIIDAIADFIATTGEKHP